jgi:hypothetical protein
MTTSATQLYVASSERNIGISFVVDTLAREVAAGIRSIQGQSIQMLK